MSKYSDLLNKMIAEKEYDSSLIEGAPIRGFLMGIIQLQSV